jgi:hypothetical protein
VGEEDLPDIIQTSNVTQHNCSEVRKIVRKELCYMRREHIGTVQDFVSCLR